jgi:hypothetical protein
LVAALVSTGDKKAAPGNARLGRATFYRRNLLIFQLLKYDTWIDGHDRHCDIFRPAID